MRRWAPRRLLGIALGIAWGSTAACSHRNSAGLAGDGPPKADRTLEQLRADIAKIQADRDRLHQRLELLEAAEQRREADQKAPASTQRAPEAGRRLPVVHVGEGEDRMSMASVETPRRLPPTHGETPDLDTGTADPRLVVQETGSRTGSSPRHGAKDARSDSASSARETNREYEAALSLARTKQYDKALQALTAFLVRYPDHPLADNAMYWRGECFFATGAYAKAAEQFEGLVARFPQGNKVPDAMLKLGLCQEKLGSQEQAQKTFAELRDRYPTSDAVQKTPRP